MELSLAYMDKVRSFKKEKADRKIKSILDQIQMDLEKVISPFIGQSNNEYTQARLMHEMQRRLDETYRTDRRIIIDAKFDTSNIQVFLNEEPVNSLQGITPIGDYDGDYYGLPRLEELR